MLYLCDYNNTILYHESKYSVIMVIYTLPQNMKEAFAHYLSECKGKDGDMGASLIDELYKKYSQKGISIFEDITDIDKFNEIIVQLREFIQSEEPTDLSLVEE